MNQQVGVRGINLMEERKLIKHGYGNLIWCCSTGNYNCTLIIHVIYCDTFICNWDALTKYIVAVIPIEQ